MITYLRTDSTRISDEALAQARSYITGTYGMGYVGNVSNSDNKNGKKIQDAHEAIRPTDINRIPVSLKDLLPRENKFATDFASSIYELGSV